MKKLNSKGFAISTLLYSLIIMVILIVMIMMSIMATTRKSTKELSETIESELNGYAKTEAEYSGVTGNVTYTVPQDGWYKIELWNGQSGGIKGDYHFELKKLLKGTTVTFNFNSNSVSCAGFVISTKVEKANSGSSKSKIRLVSTEASLPASQSSGILNNGKYYIAKKGSTEVLTVNSTDHSVSFQPLNGDKTQEWIIEKKDGKKVVETIEEDGSISTSEENITYYKIINSATSLLLAAEEETGAVGTGVKVNGNSSKEYDWLKWDIKEITTGEYQIKTLLSSDNTLAYTTLFENCTTPDPGIAVTCSDYLVNFIYSEY